MLVYGDRSRHIGTAGRLVEIADALAGASPVAGDKRGEALTRAFLLAAELAQGIADAAFDQIGEDAASPEERAALELSRAIARSLYEEEDLALAGARVEDLARLTLPATLRIKIAEGHAFYAVYPKAFWLAARRIGWREPPFVIGVRSIGTGLAAAVAVGARTGAVLTVRPIGHPFRRQIRVTDGLLSVLRAHAGSFAIVDEGPGLSGSSFAAVADMLEALGVPPDRLVFFPSHAGAPGPRATDCHRRRWREARREVVTLDDLLSEEPVGGWFADVVGVARCTEELSGGHWREVIEGQLSSPAWPMRERRKFRLTTDHGRWLARFAGLGASGEAALARATTLFDAGFTPEPIALRRGFLLERWVEGSPASFGDRGALVRHLAAYIGFRARALPAASGHGASLEALRDMAVQNAGELLGAEFGARIEDELAGLTRLAPELRPVQVDGRLHAWEWRTALDGRLVKCDAIDHCADHDLIGCQDASWDVAGASLEFRLSQVEEAELLAALPRDCSKAKRSTSLALFKRLYAAFQAGAWTMAGDAQSGEDANSCRRQAARYLAALQSPTRSRSF